MRRKTTRRISNNVANVADVDDCGVPTAPEGTIESVPESVPDEHEIFTLRSGSSASVLSVEAPSVVQVASR
jgi:hypothetical protein